VVVTCPSCQRPTRVLESRKADGGSSVRRRRECSECGRRFTTFERRERDTLWIRKRDGGRQPFDRVKLAGGLLRAAHKRPIDPGSIERLVAAIEDEAEAAGGELPAERVGELSLEGLRELDRIAYLQFASVYKGFSDPGEFSVELRRLGVEAPPKLGDQPDPGSVRGEEQS